MILVLLGTQDNSFHRLLEEINKLIENRIIIDKVVVQCGHTRYLSNNMELLDFISIEKFNELINKSNLIITHGGVGSILNAIKSNKKVIAVPRLSKYGEHVNDHQIQIIDSLDKQGLIKGVLDIKQLGNVIKTIDNFIPTPYKSSNENMLKIISDYIDNN